MIGLHMNRPLYENDIRALLMAFFPGEKIVLDGEEDPYLVRVVFSEADVFVSIEETQGRQTQESEELHLSDVKYAKNVCKRVAYRCFRAFTGEELPWGTLTGIRPARLITVRLAQGRPLEEITAELKREYYISEEKCSLCAQVAQNEERILKNLDFRTTYSLYVGIPFCPTICAYCSFSSYPLKVWKKQVWTYLDALFKELDYLAAVPTDKHPLTLYIGGGTPTSLQADQLGSLLKHLSDLYDFSAIREITVEAGRPDSITRDKLRVLRECGVDRISINPQSMKQETLDRIGRRHTVEQVRQAFFMAREEGFDNINMDLIAGLPEETADDMARTLAQIEELQPDSLTVHALAMKRAAYMNQNRQEFTPSTQETMNRMAALSRESARRMGMEPYYLYRQKNIAGNLENVGYARPGKEGLYNILIMEERQTIAAAGAGGSTKIVDPATDRIERIENVKNVKDYIERIDEMIMRKTALKL